MNGLVMFLFLHTELMILVLVIDGTKTFLNFELILLSFHLLYFNNL